MGERITVMKSFASRTGRPVKGGDVQQICHPGGAVSFHDGETGEFVKLEAGDEYDILVSDLQRLEQATHKDNPIFVEPGSQEAGKPHRPVTKLPQAHPAPAGESWDDEDDD